MKFKKGDIITIMTLKEACKNNNRNSSSYNRNFFEFIGGENVKVVSIRTSGNGISAKLMKTYNIGYYKGKIINIGFNIIKKRAFTLPDELFTMEL